jgi:cation:H+ antiporter
MASVLVSIGLFALALVVLLLASDAFVSAAEHLGLALGISPFIIGGTIVAGGTSLPELISSLFAVLADAPEIVVGTVVGSNIANIFLVLGVAAIAGRRLHVDRELMQVDLPLLVASASFLAIAAWDGQFVWYEGLLGLGGAAVYIHFTFSEERRLEEVVEELVSEHAEWEPGQEIEEAAAAADETPIGPRTYATLLVSLVLVFLSANLLVESILTLAETFEVGTEFVAITAVAVGTSLPEIAVSVVAVRRGDVDIAVGNTLGSNIFNTFAVMGIPSLLGVLTIPASVITYSLPVMILATLLYYFITQDREITAWEGVMLLLLYGLFLTNLAL